VTLDDVCDYAGYYFNKSHATINQVWSWKPFWRHAAWSRKSLCCVLGMLICGMAIFVEQARGWANFGLYWNDVMLSNGFWIPLFLVAQWATIRCRHVAFFSAPCFAYKITETSGEGQSPLCGSVGSCFWVYCVQPSNLNFSNQAVFSGSFAVPIPPCLCGRHHTRFNIFSRQTCIATSLLNQSLLIVFRAVCSYS